MINLLPPNIQENFAYGRRNYTMLRWLIGILVGTLGMVVVIGSGQLFLNRSVASYTDLVHDGNAQLKSQNLDTTQRQVTNISNDLKLVVKVLSREVLFSKLLEQIGSALPKGSILTNLNITQVAGGIDLQAAATDYQTASQIQINLQDSNTKLFTKADIVSIQCQNNGGTAVGFSSNYPCKVEIRAQFASNNQFLFANNQPSTIGTKP